jgi:hypothetical protein
VLSLERQALHAYSLSFVHPTNGELLSFFSTMPKDILDVCDAVGLETDCV